MGIIVGFIVAVLVGACIALAVLCCSVAIHETPQDRLRSIIRTVMGISVVTLAVLLFSPESIARSLFLISINTAFIVLYKCEIDDIIDIDLNSI